MFDWIVQTIEASGYWGIALLMFLENIFPPIPSELIMPVAGYSAARGELNLGLVILAGTAGSMLSALPWYYAGYVMGQARIRYLAGRFGRWLTVSPEDVDKAAIWFERYGGWAVLIGRLIPTIRTLISAPAGVTRMSMGRFLLLSTIGTTIWNVILTMGGYVLKEAYPLVEDYVNPLSTAVVVVVVGVYVFRVIFVGKRRV
jgi:membrane protein DedA with SNARE-associated domain